MKKARSPSKIPVSSSRTSRAFSDEEVEAMKEYIAEKKGRRKGASQADGERDLLAKIAAMKEPDKTLAQRVHEVVTRTAPALSPTTWYGMPAYNGEDGKVVCFFQPGQKFKTRYSTLGFSDKAKLDDGTMWPTAYALTRLTAADERRLAALVKQAAGV